MITDLSLSGSLVTFSSSSVQFFYSYIRHLFETNLFNDFLLEVEFPWVYLIPPCKSSSDLRYIGMESSQKHMWQARRMQAYGQKKKP